MIAVDNRITQLEEQLGAIGRNYRSSLDDQIASLDAVLARFGSELEQIPEREIQFARLERQTLMLAELYTMLQTRLKEAEVAEAVEDPSVRVVETAILPIEPVSPRPVRNMALAGILGLMLGVGLAFVREYMDTRLHSSDQIEHLYGLPDDRPRADPAARQRIGRPSRRPWSRSTTATRWAPSRSGTCAPTCASCGRAKGPPRWSSPARRRRKGSRSPRPTWRSPSPSRE